MEGVRGSILLGFFSFGPIDCIVYDDRAGALICEAPLASTVGCAGSQTCIIFSCHQNAAIIHA